MMYVSNILLRLELQIAHPDPRGSAGVIAQLTARRPSPSIEKSGNRELQYRWKRSETKRNVNRFPIRRVLQFAARRCTVARARPRCGAIYILIMAAGRPHTHAIKSMHQIGRYR
jgi:hypothetical protein